MPIQILTPLKKCVLKKIFFYKRRLDFTQLSCFLSLLPSQYLARPDFNKTLLYQINITH